MALVRYEKYKEVFDKFGQYKKRSYDYHASDLTKGELDSALRSMSKRANTRLRALEAGGGTEQRAYQHALSSFYSNDRAYTVTEAGELKFNTNIRALTYNEKQHLFSELQGFLSAKTSTISGIKEKYQKATDTLNKRYKEKHGRELGLTPQQIGELFDTQSVKAFSELYGSDAVLNTILSKSIERMSVEEIIDAFNSTEGAQSLNSALTRIERWKNKQGRKKKDRKKSRSRRKNRKKSG